MRKVVCPALSTGVVELEPSIMTTFTFSYNVIIGENVSIVLNVSFCEVRKKLSFIYEYG